MGSERGDIDYVYDDKAILDERNDSGAIIAHYNYADRLISLKNQTTTQFYHYQALRTTANLTNDTGAIQVSYRTDAWGHITKQEGTSENRQVFTGQEHDEKTGLICFGARFYDPDTARFTTQDSYLGEPGTPPSLHRYLYAYSNPTVYVDLLGYYNEAGHFYTTYYVARSAGYSHEEAHELAFYSQMPDEHGGYDATEAGLSGDSAHREEVYKVHALPPKERQLAEPVTKETRTMITGEPDNAEAGVLIHRLGDSYSHRVQDGTELTKDAKLHGGAGGHVEEWTAPDQIHRNTPLYETYTEDLFQTLIDRQQAQLKSKGEPPLTDEEIQKRKDAFLDARGAYLKGVNKAEAASKGRSADGTEYTAHGVASEKTIENFREETLDRYNLKSESLAKPEDTRINHAGRSLERVGNGGSVDTSHDLDPYEKFPDLRGNAGSVRERSEKAANGVLEKELKGDK